MKRALSFGLMLCLLPTAFGCSADGSPTTASSTILPSDKPASRVVDLGGGARVIFDDEPVSGSTLHVSTANPPAAADGWTSLATPVHLEVQDGSIGDGATLEFAIPEGVSASSGEVGIATFDEAAGLWMSVPVEIDASARIMRARVKHFSWWNPFSWDWVSIGASINQGVGELVGKRAGPAKCDAARPVPSWVSTTIGMTNDDAVVIRACGQSEGDVLDIQIVNNRPYGQVLSYGSAVKWGWHEPGSSAADLAVGKIMDKVLNGKGLYLPPKGRASVGIYKVSAGKSAAFPIRMSKASLLLDVLHIVATDLLPEAATGIAGELVAQCGAHLLDVTTPDHFDSAEAVRTQIVDLSGCTEAAFKALVAKKVLDSHKVDELAATLSALKKANTIGWILKAYDVEWNLLDLYVDVKLVPGQPDVGQGFRVYARADNTEPSTPQQPTTAPTGDNAELQSRVIFDNYGVANQGRAMCRGNPQRPESMPGGTVTQSFAVPGGVTSLTSALVQIDPDSRVSAALSVEVNGVGKASAVAQASGDTRFDFGPVAVQQGDQVSLSITFSASYGKIITVYTAGNPGGVFTTRNTCSDGAPSVQITNTGLRAQVVGLAR